MYGISQNPDTNHYTMVFLDEYCRNYCVMCDRMYTNAKYKWCKPCQINDLKKNFANWTSGDKKIDSFIQKMQLKIIYHDDIVFEWIPYNQFNDIKEIDKDNFFTVYLAKWKDGPLEYNASTKKYERNNSNREITLKWFYNTQSINEFLHEVRTFLIKSDPLSFHVIIFFCFNRSENIAKIISVKYMEYLKI